MGRKVSETFAYRSVTDMPLARDLRIQVRPPGQRGVGWAAWAVAVELYHVGVEACYLPVPRCFPRQAWCGVDLSLQVKNTLAYIFVLKRKPLLSSTLTPTPCRSHCALPHAL